MKKIKSLSIIISLFCSIISFAQSHNFGGNYNCKLKRGNFLNSEKLPCPACAANDKKEKDAKEAEVKKRNEKIWVDAKIKKEAEQKAYRDKLAADEKKRKAESGDVVISMPKSSTPSNSTGKRIDYRINYDNPGPFTKEYRANMYKTTRMVEIVGDGKLTYKTDKYSVIRQVGRFPLFTGRFVTTDSPCKAEYGNNSILLDEKGNQIVLQGIDKFGITLTNRENDNYFNVAVFNGKCTPVENDKYAKGDWHNITYTFEYPTMRLIESKPGWQHAECACE